MKTFTILVLALALAGSAWAVTTDAAHHSTPKMGQSFTAAVPGAPRVTGVSRSRNPFRSSIPYNDWLTLTATPVALTGPSNVPVTVGGVKYIYSFGGNSGGGSLNTIRIYNIASNSWVPQPGMLSGIATGPY